MHCAYWTNFQMLKLQKVTDGNINEGIVFFPRVQSEPGVYVAVDKHLQPIENKKHLKSTSCLHEMPEVVCIHSNFKIS